MTEEIKLSGYFLKRNDVKSLNLSTPKTSLKRAMWKCENAGLTCWKFYIVDFVTSQIWMEKGKLREVKEILNLWFFFVLFCSGISKMGYT